MNNEFEPQLIDVNPTTTDDFLLERDGEAKSKHKTKKQRRTFFNENANDGSQVELLNENKPE